jgi:hypothetical protein
VCEFFGTEKAFLNVLCAFNRLSLYQRQLAPERVYRQPVTLRSQVFVAGAILGLVGKQTALKLSQAWGGLAKHYIATNFLGHGTVNPKANESDD